jgi:hypothetical protein
MAQTDAHSARPLSAYLQATSILRHRLLAVRTLPAGLRSLVLIATVAVLGCEFLRFTRGLFSWWLVAVPLSQLLLQFGYALFTVSTFLTQMSQRTTSGHLQSPGTAATATLEVVGAEDLGIWLLLYTFLFFLIAGARNIAMSSELVAGGYS